MTVVSKNPKTNWIRAHPTTPYSIFFGNPSLTWIEHSNHNDQHLLITYRHTKYTQYTKPKYFTFVYISCRIDSVQEMFTQRGEVDTMVAGLDAQLETLESLRRGEAPPPPRMLPVPVKDPEVKVVEVRTGFIIFFALSLFWFGASSFQSPRSPVLCFFYLYSFLLSCIFLQHRLTSVSIFLSFGVHPLPCSHYYVFFSLSLHIA